MRYFKFQDMHGTCQSDLVFKKMPLCVDIQVYHRGVDDKFLLNTLKETIWLDFEQLYKYLTPRTGLAWVLPATVKVTRKYQIIVNKLACQLLNLEFRGISCKD